MVDVVDCLQIYADFQPLRYLDGAQLFLITLLSRDGRTCEKFNLLAQGCGV
jgi:hypothetical protein